MMKQPPQTSAPPQPTPADTDVGHVKMGVGASPELLEALSKGGTLLGFFPRARKQ